MFIKKIKKFKKSLLQTIKCYNLFMLSYKEIIEKLKDILSQELGNKKVFDKDVAQALEIEYNKFRQQKYRDIYIPYYDIMQFLAKRNISINYFFFNQLPESLINATDKYVILKYNNANVSAGAGTFNYYESLENIIIDKDLINYLNSNYKYTQIYNVLGDSMYPVLEDNSLIFIDTSKTILNKKDIFLIETKDGLFIKKIKLLNNKYYMHSLNQQYKDIELEEFKILGKAVGILTKL